MTHSNHTSVTTIELDLAFEPAPSTVVERSDSAALQARLNTTDGWADELRLWLQIMQSQHVLPCPAPVLKARAFSLGLQLTDDATIAELNGTWRQNNQPTDVLSFAALDDAPPLSDDPCLELGDIIISVPTARRQAIEHGHDLLWELRWLVSHGFLHLLSWDHPDDESLESMVRCQEHLLDNSGRVQEWVR
jgi:probable rRNA maturation factor